MGTIFSQYGEVANLNLVRDKVTGKTKGFCFLCYEDQRSTILAVDNLNSTKVCGRTLRVDHVEQYKVPKNIEKLDEEALQILQEGCGPNSNVLRTLTNEARKKEEENNSPSSEPITAEPPMLMQPRKTEQQPEERDRSKKRSRSRSPRHKKSTDRRHSPIREPRSSPNRDNRRQSPNRGLRRHSPSRERRRSPSREQRPSHSREHSKREKERRHHRH